uniref:Probable glutamine--tRNA ligase n=1 Tax=Parascaris univalens TaxID=6257 RepID=A0A914ZL78_PARUN
MELDLKWLGLSDSKVGETLRNATLSLHLQKIVNIAKQEFQPLGAEPIVNKTQGVCLYQLGTRLKPQCHQHIAMVVHHIINGDIKNEQQVTAAIDFLHSHIVTGFNVDEFLRACGVGVNITRELIEDEVRKVICKYQNELLKERYSFNVGKIMSEVKTTLVWADGASVKKEVDLRVMLLLGPKTEEDLLNAKMKPKKTPKEPSTQNSTSDRSSKKSKDPADLAEPEAERAETIGELMKRKIFHKVGENYKTDGYIITPKTMDLLQKHVEEVGGKVVTRFPPEPNGVLHIGHAKAININFGYAKANNGICYLRFDDTNPEKEEEKFFTAIEDMVGWLGYTPARVTHSSDYFDQLYEWAVVLIKKNLAYVCHQSVEDMRGFDVKQSPWRDRPVEESLQLFEDMRHGKFEEGAATLRLKVTLEEGKVDPVAYRIKYLPHHRAGNKWCIYPTYDYTHCLCDSIENITHSMCTKEFQSRRSSYYWLCNALDIYCPVQWEYGRLNVYYTVVSKRKIKALIDNKIVNDWDDPRLFTLTALRRRGIPPEAINNFVAQLGLTMAQMIVDPHMLDAAARDYLNNHAPRTMAVLMPLKLIIENYDEMNLPSKVSVPDFPSDPSRKEEHTVAFDREIFIERSDFREKTKDKKYRRLTKKQPIGIKYLGIVLSYVRSIKDESGFISEVIVRASELTPENKPMAFVHWVAQPVSCEVRLYERLFEHKNPEDTTAVPEGFLSDCNMNSLKVLDPVFIDDSITNSKVYDKYQFERTGYFSVDPDSTSKKLVFNRTVILKEDAGKN